MIVLLGGGLLLQPILDKRQKFKLSRDDKQFAADELLREKKALFREIKDIELDFQMGKISEADFDELTMSYKGMAMEAMKQLDRLNGVKKTTVLQPEYKVTDAEQSGYCLECGTALFIDAYFCVVFGQKV